MKAEDGSVFLLHSSSLILLPSPLTGWIMIIVLGATGTNGHQVVEMLAAKGQKVRAIVRDRGKAAPLAALGAELAEGDLSKPETLDAAFAGGSVLFLLAPVAPNQADLELDAMAAARRAGISRVVKLSAIGADPLAAGHFSRAHGIAEACLRESGLAWTIVRGAFFYSNLLFAAEAIKQSVFVGHWGDHAAAWVDPHDLAAVCTTCLIDPAHVGQTLTVTGPEALTNAQLCQRLSHALGREIKYVDQTPEAYQKILTDHGAPPWYAKAEVALRAPVVSGEASELTNVVQRLTGQSPTPITDFIQRHRTALT
jgi:uncharacterized protein YbjT (DUF2867 family)